MPGKRLTPNQLVAHNLREARLLRGVKSQDAAAEMIEPFLGVRLSRAVFSAAERSVDGNRIRPFDADEVVAFARAFDLPVSWFFAPREDKGDTVGTGDAPGLTREEVLDLCFPTNVGPVIRRAVEDASAVGGSEYRQELLRVLREHLFSIFGDLTVELTSSGSLSEMSDRMSRLADVVEGIKWLMNEKLADEERIVKEGGW